VLASAPVPLGKIVVCRWAVVRLGVTHDLNRKNVAFDAVVVVVLRYSL
jgi:hypothetical protein